MYRDGDDLSPRKKEIFRAVVESYIANGEPVGSQFLADKLSIKTSPATIRNEMAELENLGYLIQPHTSAGRIPSELGYRYYVSQLMDDYRMTSTEVEQIGSVLDEKKEEMNRILERASRVATSLTNYTSVVVRPGQRNVRVNRYKTVYLEKNKFILVMITNSEDVKTTYVRTPVSVTPELLSKLEELLNEHFTGARVGDISFAKIREVEKRVPNGELIVSNVLKAIYDSIEDTGEGDLKIEGVDRLLQYPEYSDVGRMRKLLSTFDKKSEIMDLVENSDKDALNVFIGSENSLEGLNDSTFVFRTITQGDKVIGAIGVIGPCRMDYSKVITTVENLSKQISEMTQDTYSLPEGKEDRD
ncbi:MAG: heat-inducible transcription repressor HrcA [Ruminococcaceae bacterium]|nr:heat-inducible transcription repressor HrcA [Oscillospiraceae bacterium]